MDVSTILPSPSASPPFPPAPLPVGGAEVIAQGGP